MLPKTNTSTAWEKTLQTSLTYLKDAESKAKYDWGPVQSAIRETVSKIDLVLAGSTFGIDEASNLVRMGVQEFGSTEAIVEQCLAARMAATDTARGSRPLSSRLKGRSAAGVAGPGTVPS